MWQIKGLSLVTIFLRKMGALDVKWLQIWAIVTIFSQIFAVHFARIFTVNIAAKFWSKKKLRESLGVGEKGAFSDKTMQKRGSIDKRVTYIAANGRAPPPSQFIRGMHLMDCRWQCVWYREIANMMRSKILHIWEMWMKIKTLCNVIMSSQCTVCDFFMIYW